MQKKIDFLLKLGMIIFSIVVISLFVVKMKTDTITINGIVHPLSEFDNTLIAVLLALLFLFAFFLVPPFGFITYYLIYRSVTKNKIRKNAKFERQNLEYCREHLNFLAPSLLSYLDNFDIEYEKDISAHILKLIYEKVIVVNDGHLEIANQDGSLSKSDLYVLSLIQNKKLGSKTQYEKIIEQEAKEQGLLSNKDNIVKKLLITVFIGFVLIPILFNIVFFSMAHNLSNLSIIHIFIMVFLCFFPVLLFVFTFIQVFTLLKSKTTMIRTKKGNQILKNALGLKLFLKDFSILETCSWNERSVY